MAVPAPRSLIVGHGGREAALAKRMAESSSLHAFSGHANPTLAGLAGATGGVLAIGDVCDGPAIARFAVEHGIDLALVSSDDPLAAGVVDHLTDAGIPTVGPTRAGAEIEWNKEFSRSIVERVAPDANPRHAVVHDVGAIAGAIDRVSDGGAPVVVKPIGLAGGKGVKVVGPHLADNAAAAGYAEEIIASGRQGGAVLIEERISAPEFTIQAMTDGVHTVFPAATYDYPYRFDGDTGPGTGGMGSATMAGGLFPFLPRAHYDAACAIVADVLASLAEDGRHFSGCMNAGFFSTAEGVRVIEFNSRFGDPEGINIMALLDGDWISALRDMHGGRLSAASIPLVDECSVVTYLVAPEYAIGTSSGHRFTLDDAAVAASGCDVVFSAAVEVAPGTYETVGTSRAVAIVARDPDMGAARAKVADAIASGVAGDLEWRREIGVFPAAGA